MDGAIISRMLRTFAFLGTREAAGVQVAVVKGVGVSVIDTVPIESRIIKYTII